jgi:hypothetical protein
MIAIYSNDSQLFINSPPPHRSTVNLHKLNVKYIQPNYDNVYIFKGTGSAKSFSFRFVVQLLLPFPSDPIRSDFDLFQTFPLLNVSTSKHASCESAFSVTAMIVNQLSLRIR